MTMLPHKSAPRNSEPLITGTETAYNWGKEDALEGKDQGPSAYFHPSAPEWHAYNDGYREGCLLYTALTGETRHCLKIQINTAPSRQPIRGIGHRQPALIAPTAGDYRCPHCGTHYDPTHCACCPGCGK